MSVFTADGTENQMRWNRSEGPFIEVWYATIGRQDAEGAVWLRYTITSPRRGEAFCELWGFCFAPAPEDCFAGKRRYPIDRLGAPNGRDDGGLVRIGDAWLSERHLEGEVEFQGRSMGWSLDFEPADRCFQHLPELLRRRAQRRVSVVCSPNLDVPFSGTVTLDGRAMELDRAPGQQSHRWGRGHPSSWAWAHCSTFEETPAIFEAVAARTKLGGIPAPTLTFLYLSYKGEELAFNQAPWVFRSKGRYEMPTWAFTGHNDRWRIVGGARATPQRMMQASYEDPDGSMRYCANSEVADLAIEIFKRTDRGWQHVDSLVSMRRAHLEFGRRGPFYEIPLAF